MRKRTKYAIVYGIGGLFLSYIVYAVASVLSWLLILGDGPTSSGQGLIASFFTFGITIIFWLFIVYLGYRFGIEAENSINVNTTENRQETLHFIKKAVFKVILIIIVAATILFSLAFWSISKEKHSPTSSTTKEYVTNTSAPPDQKKYDIMNFMEEARIYATYCNDEKKEIVSANGGDKFCDEGASYNSIRRLRQMAFCGSSPADTKWVITNGKSSDWTVEINCKNFTTCNGKNNAYCNTNGCTFNKGCDPRKK